jgi:phosphoenolpyruvate synthase/pyruvate phosphate dikinase
VSSLEHGEMPQIPVKIVMNVGNPQMAFGFSQIPNSGVGLARLRRAIPAAERARLLKDLRFAPAWMHPHLRAVAGASR